MRVQLSQRVPMKIHIPWGIDLDNDFQWQQGERALAMFRKFAPNAIVDIDPKYAHLASDYDPEPWPPVFIRDYDWNKGFEFGTRSYSRAYPSKFKFRCLLRRIRSRSSTDEQLASN